MISKAKIKYIRSLEQKKNRNEEGVYVAEGPKVVGDLLKFFRPEIIVATEEGLSKYTFNSKTEVIEVSDIELKKVSFLQHPQQILAVFPQFNQRLICRLCGAGYVARVAVVAGERAYSCRARCADGFGRIGLGGAINRFAAAAACARMQRQAGLGVGGGLPGVEAGRAVDIDRV